MSASLVGSEMCIRDSCRACGEARNWACRGKRRQRQRPQEDPAPAQPRVCLLYTSDAADDM
eukprot:2061791-Alexandrium_andersonii.AAC.1